MGFDTGFPLFVCWTSAQNIRHVYYVVKKNSLCAATFPTLPVKGLSRLSFFWRSEGTNGSRYIHGPSISGNLPPLFHGFNIKRQRADCFVLKQTQKPLLSVASMLREQRHQLGLVTSLNGFQNLIVLIQIRSELP